VYPKRLPSENSLNISRLQPPKQSKVIEVIYSIIPHNFSEKKLKAEIFLRMGRGYIIKLLYRGELRQREQWGPF